jgi:mono/diheme cytochrome c family protein
MILCLTAAGYLSAQAIKKVPLSQTSPVSGKQMFDTYCAVCPGADGKGVGPAATALKRQPSDLTQLAVRNNGKFPDLQVATTLTARNVAAHGSEEMPMWGDLFKSLGSGDNDIVHMRITNLTSYLESIQQK